jgi:hypothetical protein
MPHGVLQLSLRALRENASHFAIYTNSIGPQPPAGAAPSQCSATGLGAMCASHRPVESAPLRAACATVRWPAIGR